MFRLQLPDKHPASWCLVTFVTISVLVKGAGSKTLERERDPLATAWAVQVSSLTLPLPMYLTYDLERPSLGKFGCQASMEKCCLSATYH